MTEKVAKTLACRFFCDDLNKELSVKDYLKELLKTLWIEDEGFSGKRPFGNSSWKCDLAKPLIQAKIIKGTLDSDGYVETMDDADFDSLILFCIESL